MTDLSPQAQAVLDAFTGNDTIHGLHLMTPRLAAALMAVADQVVPKCDMPLLADDAADAAWDARDDVRDDLLSIADELKGQS